MLPESQSVAQSEYTALRATIRERGTLRLFVIFLTIVAWAGLVVAVDPAGRPALALATLLVLAAGFEVVLAAHTGVERVGRYIQHRYERHGLDQVPAWEHMAMALGRPGSGVRGPDPLAFWLLLSATAVNLLFSGAGLAALGGVGRVSWAAITVLAHALLAGRMARARRFARRQREVDLAAMKAAGPPNG